MSNSARRHTRRKKIENDEALTMKEKFAEEVEIAVRGMKFEAASQNQKKALAYLREGRQVVGLFGSAGTGKSMLATYHASTQLRAKKVDKIILLRPNVHCGKSIGLLTGNENEKLAPFFVQTIEHLKKFLGKSYVPYAQEKEIIQTKAFEYVRGQSFENAVVIAEEVQTFTEEEFETLLTRIGDNCQMILTGDTRQVNKGDRGGLVSTFHMVESAIKYEPDYLDDEDIFALRDNFGIVHFTPEDIVRSGLVRALVKLYYNK